VSLLAVDVNLLIADEISLAPPFENVEIRILVSLPATYPKSSPPQLQLLSKYIGSFGVDASLFGSVLRTFISSNGVEWSEDTICVFDGLQNVLERCAAWYSGRLSADNQVVLQDTKALSGDPKDEVRDQIHEVSKGLPSAIPEGVEIIEAEVITDRKSSFVGRACRISHPSQAITSSGVWCQ
jgi:hypothetical protein